MHRFIIAALGFFMIHTYAFAEITPDQEKELQRRWEKIEKCEGRLGCRDVMYFAIEAAALGWQPEKIGKAMSLLVEMQDRDKTSKTYGNFRWYWEQPKPIDQNAVEFIMQQGILLWNLYRNVLAPADQDKLKDIMEVSIDGIRSHRVGIDYTNIYLMKMWNCIGLGEALGKNDLAEEGYSMLDQWYKHVSQYGITEYNSTTYYAVDLDNLALIQKFAKKENGKIQAEKAIKFIWAQVNANWYSPALRLGGSRSRDYDYLTGHGDVERHAFIWGMLPERKPPLLDAVYKLTNTEAPKDTKILSNFPLPRFVCYRWGKNPERYASKYIAKTFAIGVAGACAGPEDKFFAADFADHPKMVMMNYFMDGRGDPYGQNREKLKDGHQKSHHLIPFVASSQVGADILFSTSYIYDAKRPTPQCLLSHLYFPIETEVWVGNIPAPILLSQRNEQYYLKSDWPVFLKYKNSAIAFRFIDATDTKGQQVHPIYHKDGDKYKASRISWVHSPESPGEEAHMIMWVSAAEVNDAAAFAKFRETISLAKVESTSSKGVLAAKVTKVDGSQIKLEADPFTGKRVSDTPLPAGIFSVNGEEIGTEILR